MIPLMYHRVLLQGIMYDHDEMLANAASIPGAETAIFAECCKRNKVKQPPTFDMSANSHVDTANTAQHYLTEVLVLQHYLAPECSPSLLY
jgi:hypothetical protein